jgi:hypothetical protein
MKSAKCKMTQGKNLNAFLSPASLELTESTEERFITISFINNSKNVFLSAISEGSVRDNCFFPYTQHPYTAYLTP